MKQAVIEGFSWKVNFYTKEEIDSIEDEETKETTKVFYELSHEICRTLSIEEEPHLAFLNELTSIDPATFAMTRLQGMRITPDKTNLDKDIILLVYHEATYNKLAGTLAHELRHMWQNENNEKIQRTKAIGIDALYDEAEIDADAFAIYYMASRYFDFNYRECADIICSFEKKTDKKAYEIRLKRAKLFGGTFYDNYENAVAKQQKKKRLTKDTS